MLNGLVRGGSSRARLVRGLCACLLLIGCGDDEEAMTAGPDAALLGVVEGLPPIGDFDAAVEEEPTPDSATPDDAAAPDDAAMPEPDAAPALDDEAPSISGVVLTNAPHIGFTNVGTDGLVIVSANFIVQEASSGLAFIHMFGDVENQGAELQCQMLTDSFSFDGGPDELVVVTSNPYKSATSSSTLSTECIEPGQRGVWNGIISDVPVDFIENARALSYNIDGARFFDDYLPSALEPAVLYADPRMGDAGWFIAGLIRTGDLAIYNVGIDFFARDRYGLIFDDTTAYPEDLGTLDPNITLYYESFPFLFSEAKPDSVTSYAGYIEGADPSPGDKSIFDAPEPGERGERTLAVARARRTLRDVKERLSLDR